MFVTRKNIKKIKDMDRLFGFKATLLRNTISGVCLAGVLVLIGLVAGEGIKLVIVCGLGLLFIPIGVCIDQMWYQQYKKKTRK